MNRATTPPYLLGGCHPASLRPWGKGAGGGTCHPPPPPAPSKTKRPFLCQQLGACPAAMQPALWIAAWLLLLQGMWEMSPWRGWVGPGTRSRAPHPAPTRCASVFCPCFACLVGVKHGWAFPLGGLFCCSSPQDTSLAPRRVPASQGCSARGRLLPVPQLCLVAIPPCPSWPSRSAQGSVPQGMPGAVCLCLGLSRSWSPS